MRPSRNARARSALVPHNLLKELIGKQERKNTLHLMLRYRGFCANRSMISTPAHDGTVIA
jgi:hypothetical protein